MRCDLHKKYLIFCVTDINYLENTYVTLHSFFKYNDYKVTVFTTDIQNFDIIKNRLKEFNVDVKYIDISVELKHFFYKNIEPVIAKLKIFDTSEYEYNLSFDTDTLFFGSIDDVIKEYNKSFIGVNEPVKNNINVGFCIYKKQEIKLFEKFKELSLKYGYFNCPEQDFMNFVLTDREYLDSKYNFCNWTYNGNNEIIMFHYASDIKPFRFRISKELTKGFLFQLKYFKLYFDYIKDLKLSKEFINNINKAKKFYETYKKYSLFYNVE